jgi:large subunit ribosomal protein L10
MPKERKKQVVDKLIQDLCRSSLIIATNYQGLPAKQMADFRRALVRQGIEYHVVKNTLLRLAAESVGKPQLMSIIEGPIALAFSRDDAVNAAKVFTQCLKSMGLPLQVRGGLLKDRILLPQEVTELANLPTKETLIANLIGQLQAPIRALQCVLSLPVQGLINLLQSKSQVATN